MAAHWKDPRFALTLLILGLFAFAFAQNPGDEAMKGALIAAFAAAYGFWLGSSSGSQRKDETIAAQASALGRDPAAGQDGEER